MSRGLRPGRRPADREIAGPDVKIRFWRATADLWSLVLRSRAKGLPIRLTAALAFTICGKAMGVFAAKNVYESAMLFTSRGSFGSTTKVTGMRRVSPAASVCWVKQKQSSLWK